MSYKTFLRNQVLEYARDCSTFGPFLFAALLCTAAALYDVRIAIRLAAGLAIVEGTGSLVKLLFYTPRPDRQSYDNLIEKIDAGSFPSIHCARVTMLAVVSSPIGGAAIFLGGLLVLLTGCSRWYIRRHHFIDILAGCVLGLAAAGLVLAVL